MKCKICLKKIAYMDASFPVNEDGTQQTEQDWEDEIPVIIICHDCVKKELKKTTEIDIG